MKKSIEKYSEIDMQGILADKDENRYTKGMCRKEILQNEEVVRWN